MKQHNNDNGYLRNLLLRLLSGVFFHSVHEVIVNGDEVTDEGSGAQAQATSLWQQYLQVSIQSKICLSVVSRKLDLP